MNVFAKSNRAKDSGATRLARRSLPVRFVSESASHVHVHIAKMDREPSLAPAPLAQRRPMAARDLDRIGDFAAVAPLPPATDHCGPAKNFHSAARNRC